MEFRRFGDTYIIRMDRGEEILSTLAGLCEAEDIRLARVGAIGASDRAVVGVYDVDSKTYHKETLEGPMEITCLCGTVTRMEGKPYLHLHVTLADSAHRARGGHANELRVSATCEMTLSLIPGEVNREYDDVTGLNLFRFI